MNAPLTYHRLTLWNPPWIKSQSGSIDIELSLIYSSRCKDTRAKIAQLTETDYAVAKADVDRLREELGQPALPSLQSTLDEKTSQ
jgi:hypothetical protein